MLGIHAEVEGFGAFWRIPGNSSKLLRLASEKRRIRVASL